MPAESPVCRLGTKATFLSPPNSVSGLFVRLRRADKAKMLAASHSSLDDVESKALAPGDQLHPECHTLTHVINLRSVRAAWLRLRDISQPHLTLGLYRAHIHLSQLPGPLELTFSLKII